jgi:hypothetical protein
MIGRTISHCFIVEKASEGLMGGDLVLVENFRWRPDR